MMKRKGYGEGALLYTGCTYILAVPIVLIYWLYLYIGCTNILAVYILVVLIYVKGDKYKQRGLRGQMGAL